MGRLIVWQGLDATRVEAVELRFAAGALVARGTQLGAAPRPYRADYELETSDGFVTRRLEVVVTEDQRRRRLVLRHDGAGGWTWEAEGAAIATTTAAELADARDCDLGFSPLTNTLPVRRLRLAERGGGVDVVTAWVSMPDLGLHRYPQRYELVEATSSGSVVRFIDRGLSPGFTADLQLDRDGFVAVYPQLASRL